MHSERDVGLEYGPAFQGVQRLWQGEGEALGEIAIGAEGISNSYHFHPALLDLCEQAVREISGSTHRMPSGPLHDAAEVSRAGIPTVMMFVQSLNGISHNKIEDTRQEHLEMSVTALDKLASKTVNWMVK